MTSNPVTLVVDTTADNIALSACTAAANDCSLRGANSVANDGDTIVFEPGVFGNLSSPEGVATITLGSEIAITDDLTITGPGADDLTIDGGAGTNRVFFIDNSIVTISGITITGGGGTGTSPSGLGSAILVNGGTFNLVSSTVTNNINSTVVEGGGGIFLNGGADHTIFSSTISANTAVDCGGLHTNASSTTIVNTTISGNSASGGVLPSGGGFCVSGGTLTMRSTTVTLNSAASGSGGGAFVGAATLNLGNSIIAGNTAPANADIDNSTGTVTTAGRNIVGDNTDVAATFPAGGPNANNDYAGTLADPINPMLGPLQNNGGPTATHLPQPGFPGHDKGCAFASTLEQRGFTRTLDWTNIPNGTACAIPAENGTDIGAVEILAPSAARVAVSGRVLTPDGRGLMNAVVTMSDLQGSIRIARTSSFGYFRFDDVLVGESYFMAVRAKRFQFEPRILNVTDELSDVDFFALTP